MTSISEFERNKPRKTYAKIKFLQKMIKDERQKAKSLYAERMAFLDEMDKGVDELIDIFKKGE